MDPGKSLRRKTGVSEWGSRWLWRCIALWTRKRISLLSGTGRTRAFDTTFVLFALLLFGGFGEYLGATSALYVAILHCGGIVSA